MVIAVSSSEIARFKNRKKNRKYIDDLYNDLDHVYVIHYSCESFYKDKNVDGEIKNQSVRVTSIGVRNLSSAQTHSWSIYSAAELLKCVDCIEDKLDELEKNILDNYFTFLKIHGKCKYIHWNMRDRAFGFQALEHRYEVLGGTPYMLQDDNKFDLARILVSLYGLAYAPHTSLSGRKGRLMSICEMNKITDKDALQGAEEAQAFVENDFLKLDRSTLRKLDMLANIFERVHANKLVTNAKFLDKYALHPIIIIELIKKHPAFSIIAFIATIVGIIYKFTNLLPKIF